MLKINPRQMAAFAQNQEDRFRQTLLEKVLQDNADYARLHPLILLRLLGLALQRARGYGFTWEHTLAQFVLLMTEVAPTFDQHPAVHLGLTNPAVPVEERIDALLESLPEGVWDEAAAGKSRLGWFLTQDTFAFTPAARIALALSNALPQDLAKSPTELEAQISSALTRAKAIGFGSEDGQFVYAAAYIIYGAELETQPAWAKDVFGQKLAVAVQTALLRTRVAIDTAAWL